MTALAPDASDDELVRRSLAGEARAFAQLVERHQRLVFAVAFSHARDAAQAEDVAQEAFVEAWRLLPRLRDGARVGAWLAGIARNLGRRWERHTARRRRRETTAMQGVPDEVRTGFDSTLDREVQALVRDALGAIPDAYREALVVYYVHGQSVAEVAAGLGIREDLVKQRLSRGRRALRASLEKRIQGALEQLGPRNALTATVMAGVGTASMRKAAAANSAATAGKVVFAMKASKLAVVGIALLVAAGVAWYWRSTTETKQARTARTAAATPVATSPSSGRDEHVRAPYARKLATREKREQLLEAIRSAHQHRNAAASSATTTSSAATAGAATASVPPPSTVDDDDRSDSDRDYIQEAMTGLLPMIVDCYKQARELQPTLAGTLVVNFTIEGEPGIGGLVTESVIDAEQSEIQDPGLGQCVQETMFALEIDPPTNGGTIRVTYPFTFRPRT